MQTLLKPILFLSVAKGSLAPNDLYEGPWLGPHGINPNETAEAIIYASSTDCVLSSIEVFKAQQDIHKVALSFTKCEKVEYVSKIASQYDKKYRCEQQRIKTPLATAEGFKLNGPLCDLSCTLNGLALVESSGEKHSFGRSVKQQVGPTLGVEKLTGAVIGLKVRHSKSGEVVGIQFELAKKKQVNQAAVNSIYNKELKESLAERLHEYADQMISRVHKMHDEEKTLRKRGIKLRNAVINYLREIKTDSYDLAELNQRGIKLHEKLIKFNEDIISIERKKKKKLRDSMQIFLFMTGLCILVWCFCIGTIHCMKKEDNIVIEEVEESSRFINDFPSFCYKSLNTSTTIMCCICMESVNEGSKVRKLSCNHIYHQNCIDQWLREKMVCPTCGQQLVSVDLYRSSVDH